MALGLRFAPPVHAPPLAEKEETMIYLLCRNLLLVTCCALGTTSSVYAKDCKKVAEQLFTQRFNERRIEGTGHVFSIVVKCDSKRLKGISGTLRGDKMQVVDYDFALELFTKQKYRSHIVGGRLSKISEAVEACIINRYQEDVTFMPGAPSILEERVRFPVVLFRGRPPIFPSTPVGVVSEEN